MFYSFFFILVVCLSIHSSLKKKKQLSCNFLAQMYKIKVNEIN